MDAEGSGTREVLKFKLQTPESHFFHMELQINQASWIFLDWFVDGLAFGMVQKYFRDHEETSQHSNGIVRSEAETTGNHNQNIWCTGRSTQQPLKWACIVGARGIRASLLRTPFCVDVLWAIWNLTGTLLPTTRGLRGGDFCCYVISRPWMILRPHSQTISWSLCCDRLSVGGLYALRTPVLVPDNHKRIVPMAVSLNINPFRQFSFVHPVFNLQSHKKCMYFLELRHG